MPDPSADLLWVVAGFTLVYLAMAAYVAALRARLVRARQRIESLDGRRPAPDERSGPPR